MSLRRPLRRSKMDWVEVRDEQFRSFATARSEKTKGNRWQGKIILMFSSGIFTAIAVFQDERRIPYQGRDLNSSPLRFLVAPLCYSFFIDAGCSGGLAGILGCDRNPDPLKITGPSVDKFEKITLLISKISMFKRIQVTEMKIKSLERKYFSIAYQGHSG